MLLGCFGVSPLSRTFKERRICSSQSAGGPGGNRASPGILLSCYSPCNTFHRENMQDFPIHFLQHTKLRIEQERENIQSTVVLFCSLKPNLIFFFFKCSFSSNTTILGAVMTVLCPLSLLSLLTTLGNKAVMRTL